MKSAWLGVDDEGRVALFVRGWLDDDAGALRAEARVIGALVARDGVDWLAGGDEDDEDERVVLVCGADAAPPIEGYRLAAPPQPLEEVVADASWFVAREGVPRVLASRGRLTRADRFALRAHPDCMLLVGERRARAQVRARTDAVTLYRRRRGRYHRTRVDAPRPLAAREVRGWLARVPVRFSRSPALYVADAFDGEYDATWGRQRPPLDPRELPVTFVRNAFYVAFVLGPIAWIVFGTWIAVAAAIVVGAVIVTVAQSALTVTPTLIESEWKRGAVEVPIPATPEVRSRQ